MGDMADDLERQYYHDLAREEEREEMSREEQIEASKEFVNKMAMEEKKDMVNQPPHYKVGTVETIDMMERIWGRGKLAIYCEITAFKYRMRAGHKIDASEDIAKAKWYENKAKILRGDELPF